MSSPALRRQDRLLAEAEARELIASTYCGRLATITADGWPYVVPLVYVYEGGDLLYLHTGDHQGHFLTNLQSNFRICVEVSEIGDLHRGMPYACNSALVYTSVIVFGPVKILTGPESRDKKAWFLDRLLVKHGKPDWTFEPGYPLIDRIILYEQKIEVVTGKHSSGLYH